MNDHKTNNDDYGTNTEYRPTEQTTYQYECRRAIVEADQWGYGYIPEKPRNPYPVWGVDFE